MMSQADLKPKSLSIEDALQYTGIGKTTLYGLFKQKKLTPIKIGSKTLILKEEIDAFLDGLARKAV